MVRDFDDQQQQQQQQEQEQQEQQEQQQQQDDHHKQLQHHLHHQSHHHQHPRQQPLHPQQQHHSLQLQHQHQHQRHQYHQQHHQQQQRPQHPHLCDQQPGQRLHLRRIREEEAGADADELPKLLLQPPPVPGQVLLCPGQQPQQQREARALRHGQPLLQASPASFASGYYVDAAYDSSLLGETPVPQPHLGPLLADQGVASCDGTSAEELRQAQQQSQTSVPEPSLDVAEESVDGDLKDPGSPSNVVGTADAGGSSSVPDFVKKLYRMLEDPSCSDTVLWAKGRDKFVVRDPNVFAKHVLPRHFKHNNFASFVRQLNKYDFHKAKVDPEDANALGDNAWSFRHPNFHADKTDLLVRIKRKVPNRGGKTPASVTSLADSSRSATDQASVNGTTNGLVCLNARLQQQVEEVMRQQTQLAKTVELLGRNYNFVVEELTRSKDLLAAQDEVLRMARCVFANASTDIRPAQRVSTEAWQMLRPGLSTTLHQSRRCSPELSFQQASEGMIDDQGAAGVAARFKAMSFPPVDGSLTSTSEAGGNAGDRSLSINGVLGGVDSGSFDDNLTQPGTPLPGSCLEGVSGSASASAVACLWSKAEKQTRPMRVLVVDDDIVHRQISGSLLKVFGCTCDVATDGIGAVDKMGCAKYDIVLMDISMPNLDGISATTRIRQFDRTTPIICVTSSASAQDRIIYLTNGMNDVLAKPFSRQGLRSVLAKFCREPLRSGTPIRMIEDSDRAEDGAALKEIVEEGIESAAMELPKRQPDGDGDGLNETKRSGYQRQSQHQHQLVRPIPQPSAESSSSSRSSTIPTTYASPIGYPQGLPAGAWESFLSPNPAVAVAYRNPTVQPYATAQQHGRQGHWQHQHQPQQTAQWGPAGEAAQQPSTSSLSGVLPPAPPAPFSVSFAEADHRLKRPRLS